MVTQNTIFKTALILFYISLAVVTKTVFSQDCWRTGCPGLKECCSEWGYCNVTGTEHCNFWCHSGPCNLTYRAFGVTPSSVSDGPRGKIESIVTPALFDRIMSKVGSNCSGKGFYTREAFIAAVKLFGEYKGTVAKREIAAILSHFSHGSKSFCYKEEKTKEKYCSKSKKYICEPGKSYYGRGPLQAIRWNEYYGAAGKFLGLPLLKDPDMVARDPEVAFKFAMWYWNKYVRPALYLGFQETSKRVDGGVCNREDMEKLVKQYSELCKTLGVTPDENIGFCYKEEKAKEKYCSKSKKYICEPGKSYYGRGPLQAIRWNEYYGAAGKFLGLPLLKDPDMVARDPEVAFKFAMWYWNKYVRPALYLGFQETSKRVDGGVCNREDMEKLVKQYSELCKTLGVTPDDNIGLYC